MNPLDSKRILWAWAMYDFANSAFTTLVVTFIYGTYFTESFHLTKFWYQYWSWGISITAVLVSFRLLF